MTTPSALPDPSTAGGRAVIARLETDLIAWLTTVTADGRLQSSAVWFLWTAGEFLVFSRAGAPRARNIAAHGHVSIHLNSDEEGDGIVTFEGDARLDPEAPPASAIPAYIAKYGGLIKGYRWTPESFSRDYPDPIRIRPTRLRLG
jgi:PPOX class probable F420-dependent enzyme